MGSVDCISALVPVVSSGCPPWHTAILQCISWAEPPVRLCNWCPVQSCTFVSDMKRLMILPGGAEMLLLKHCMEKLLLLISLCHGRAFPDLKPLSYFADPSSYIELGKGLHNSGSGLDLGSLHSQEAVLAQSCTDHNLWVKSNIIKQALRVLLAWCCTSQLHVQWDRSTWQGHSQLRRARSHSFSKLFQDVTVLNAFVPQRQDGRGNPCVVDQIVFCSYGYRRAQILRCVSRLA